jgi:hypothetical protein
MSIEMIRMSRRNITRCVRNDTRDVSRRISERAALAEFSRRIASEQPQGRTRRGTRLSHLASLDLPDGFQGSTRLERALGSASASRIAHEAGAGTAMTSQTALTSSRR